MSQMNALGLTKTGTPRKRRPRLSASVRQVEHNVLMHIKRDVRHTGRGWQPLLLDCNWEAAVKRMVKDGILMERPDLGGYVPAEMVAGMEQENSILLDYVTTRTQLTQKPVQLKGIGRDRAAALSRLVLAGQISFDPQHGYSATL